jgi:toxin YoeB
MNHAVRLELADNEHIAVFQPEYLEDLHFWVETDYKLAIRLLDLINVILRDPYDGIGKPEP